MKPTCFILLIYLLPAYSVFAQKNVVIDNGWQLTGNVKTVIEIEHNKVDTTVQPYKIDMAQADTQYAKFDKDGYLIETGWSINPAFSLIPPPYSKGRKIYHYNNSGLLTEERDYKSDTLVEKNEYQYDNKGYKTEMDSYKPNGDLSLKTIFTCDKKGNVLKKEEVDDYGTPISEEDFKYDKKGNNIIAEGIYYSNKMSYKFICKYNEKGKCIEQDIYRSKSDKNYTWKSNNKYDDKGNMIEWDSFKFPVELTDQQSETYVYDSHDNWIQCTEMQDGKPDKLTLRTIIYY